MLSGVIPKSSGIPPDISIKLDMTVLLVLSIFPRFVSLMSFVSSLPVGIIATLGFLKTFSFRIPSVEANAKSCVLTTCPAFSNKSLHAISPPLNDINDPLAKSF